MTLAVIDTNNIIVGIDLGCDGSSNIVFHPDPNSNSRHKDKPTRPNKWTP